MLRRRWIDFDPWTPFFTVLLLVAGLVTIYSATYGSRGMKYIHHHLISMAIGLVILITTAVINYEWLLTIAPYFYASSLALLVITLVFGKTISGSRSWISLGSISLQTAEVAKIAVALMWARIFGGRTPQRLRHFTFGDFITSSAISSIPMVLILLQPDFGTVLTFIPPLILMWLLLRMPWKYWVVLIFAMSVLIPVGWSHLKPYQKARILVFAQEEKMDPKGPAYQVFQSKIAIGAGGLLGKGFQKGSQTQLGFVPERHTDFVLTTLGEEWGFAGISIILCLYAFLFYRWLDMASQTYDLSGQMLIIVFLGFWCCHVIINAGMVIGWAPVTGLPLPLISYGGSFLLFCMASTGIIMNVYWLRRIIQMKLE